MKQNLRLRQHAHPMLFKMHVQTCECDSRSQIQSQRSTNMSKLPSDKRKR